MSDEQRNTPVWHIESTHPQLVEPVKEALRQVMDPEIGLNIIELGLVRDITVHGDVADVNMIMTTPFCPYAPALLEATKQKAAEGLGMRASMSLGMEPWDPSMMEEGAGAAWGFY
jgi:metal-sulfur cluster biosynthetic enzyme